MNAKVDAFLARSKWPAEVTALRAIALGCGLGEELKWGLPCYTLNASNVVLIQEFKAYCALLFFKGALLKDGPGALHRIGANTQSGRQLRFTDVQGITAAQALVRAYIQEAIAIENAGLKVELKKTSEFAVPEEFQTRLDGTPALKAAFEALTPGRQRAYLLHFAAAKQARTRESRIDKCTPLILGGKGLND